MTGASAIATRRTISPESAAVGQPSGQTAHPIGQPRGWLVNPLYYHLAFRVPRRWSNRCLAGHGALVTGDVVNVSAYRDLDKQGRRYRDYFPNARSYAISNYTSDRMGACGIEGEFFLDLEAPVPSERLGSFDAVLNHTVLEHVFDLSHAFAAIAALSRDLVLTVVPWKQPTHSHYGDYWRVSPLALDRLHRASGLTTLHLAWMGRGPWSQYVYGVGSRQPERWASVFDVDAMRARLDALATERRCA